MSHRPEPSQFSKDRPDQCPSVLPATTDRFAGKLFSFPDQQCTLDIDHEGRGTKCSAIVTTHPVVRVRWDAYGITDLLTEDMADSTAGHVQQQMLIG